MEEGGKKENLEDDIVYRPQGQYKSDTEETVFPMPKYHYETEY